MRSPRIASRSMRSRRKLLTRVPYKPDIWGAGWNIQRFGWDQWMLHLSFPDLFPRTYALQALSFILGVHPGSNTASFVSGVGANSLTTAYGFNRADWSHIPGGSASGTALIRPDFPELKTWPFFWQQTEYVLGRGTTDYLLLVLAADHVLKCAPMNLRRNALLWLLIAAPLTCAAAAPSPSPIDESVRELARQWLVVNDGVGLSIGVYAGGQRHFYNFGTTRLDGNKVPTKDTVYEIGAVAKTMTGQLLARAVVEGRASLNDEAAKYLDEPYPNLENGGEVVRLLHLANMTSQLVDNIPDLTQVRMVAGESLLSNAHARAREVHARGVPAAAAPASRRAARRAAIPGTRTSRACCSVSCSRRSTASRSRSCWRAKSKSR